MSSSSAPALPTLIVTGGASDGLQIQLEAPGAEKTIGSGATSHIRLTSRNVDFTHARIAWEDTSVLLSDEGSAAGTFVNGEKVAVGHVLQDGDRISIGPPGSPESVKLLVRVPSDLAAAAALPGIFDAPTAFTGSDDDPLVFADPASAEGFMPAFSAPAGPIDTSADAAIVFEEEVEAAATAEPVVIDLPPAKPAAPVAPVPPAASVPAASAPPARAARTPAAVRGDYMSEIPSIGGDRVREAPNLPAAESARGRSARPRVPSFDLSRIPRPALVAAAALLLGLGAYSLTSRSQQPPPVLSGVTPPKAEIGTTITLLGTGFASSAADNTVTFGDTRGTVTSASSTSLTVTVPAVSVPPGKGVAVEVKARGDRSNALFVKIARLPRILRVEPDVAVPGTEVTLHGQNFEGPSVAVKIGGERVAVKDPRPDALRVTVPEMPWTDGQSVSVTVEIGPDTARAMPLLMGRLPLVAELAPSSGEIGQRLTIKGRGFDPTPAGNRVTIGGAPALVLAAAPNELQVAIPAAPTTGSQVQLPVVVEARGATSSGRVTFALVHPLSGNARLRFYAAPAPQGGPGRHVFVSTEIGPVLVLTGKADAGSLAERAEAVARSLTALVEGAAGRPVTVEVRDGATPAVAVAGGPVLVSATPEDVEGYALSWDGGAKPARATPRQIANYWAALLQDYVTLFGQGQRPSRTAELSARGKVLVDLFAEAQRRGASGGVPVATLYELSGAGLKNVRDMALVIPTGASAAGTAVAGRWEGTMADTEAERSIEVQLQADGGRLGGSLTTKTGGIAVRTPLQQVTYDKGQLRFVMASGGGARQFRGTLEGATLSGSIFKDTTGKDAVGRFSLRYVE